MSAIAFKDFTDNQHGNLNATVAGANEWLASQVNVRVTNMETIFGLVGYQTVSNGHNTAFGVRVWYVVEA